MSGWTVAEVLELLDKCRQERNEAREELAEARRQLSAYADLYADAQEQLAATPRLNQSRPD